MANKTLSAVVIDALEDIKARDIQLVNVSKITSVFDYIAIASADSTRQTKALANNVVTKVKEAGYYVIGTEGEGSGEWVLVDCGDIVVHIMQPAVREYYKLEELWREGKLEFPRPSTARPIKAVEEAQAPAKARGGAKKTVGKTAGKATAKAAPKTAKTVANTARTRVADGVKTSTSATRQAVGGTVAKQPAAVKPTAARPPAVKPSAKKPAAKKPAAKKPAAKKPAAKKPAAKKPAAKKPVAKKPAAKKPAAKKPTAKKPAAKKPAAKKPATRKRAG